MGQKGTGRRLSDQERMEIIARLEVEKPRASAAECARQYGVSSAAITKLMKMKDKIKQRFKENNTFSQQRKRGGTERHAAFEDELFQWITLRQQEHQAVLASTAALMAQQQPATVPVVVPVPMALLTPTKVQEKAQELLKAHDLGSFRASKGWYYRFCRRYGLSRTSLNLDDGDHGEDGGDDGLDHSDSESDASNCDDDGQRDATDGLPASGDSGISTNTTAGRAHSTKTKRKDASSKSGKKAKKSGKTKGWGGVDSLQDTLAKAAVALNHPDARHYLGENAAGEMLRSIQQSIGVVQCIRLKKTEDDEELTAVEDDDALTMSAPPSLVEEVAAVAAIAPVAETVTRVTEDNCSQGDVVV